jgi:DNA-directed RNA polymerase specialized sigma24 family protein
VAVALAALPHNERLAFALLASGYREVEIARPVGKTLRTLRNWLASTRAQLLQGMQATI